MKSNLSYLPIHGRTVGAEVGTDMPPDISGWNITPFPSQNAAEVYDSEYNERFQTTIGQIVALVSEQLGSGDVFVPHREKLFECSDGDRITLNRCTEDDDVFTSDQLMPVVNIQIANSHKGDIIQITPWGAGRQLAEEIYENYSILKDGSGNLRLDLTTFISTSDILGEEIIMDEKIAAKLLGVIKKAVEEERAKRSAGMGQVVTSHYFTV